MTSLNANVKFLKCNSFSGILRTFLQIRMNIQQVNAFDPFIHIVKTADTRKSFLTTKQHFDGIKSSNIIVFQNK